jgi:di/tricarboxylate transporter
VSAHINAQQVAFILILAASFTLLITERLRNDIVAVLIVLALYCTRILDSRDALAGFSSEPAIVVVSIFILSASMHHTGLSERIGRLIGRLAGRSYNRVVAIIMIAVALFSAFTHHVTTTAVMLPITLNLSRERNIPASKLLMPVSFAASLGTTITIIGAPAFLLASSTLQQAGRPGLGIFSIAPIGLALSVIGTIFTIVVGRYLLPAREGAAETTSRFRLDQYFTEFSVLPGSRLLDKTIDELEGDDQHRLEVVELIRHGNHLSRPFGSERLRVGDVILVRTSPEEIAAIRQDAGLELRPIALYGAEGTPAEGGGNGGGSEAVELLVQAIVAPGSELTRRTIGQVDFRARYGVVVVGLWRRRGWVERELSKTRLRAGDVLVLEGDEDGLSKVSNDPAFLMMVPFQGEAQVRRKAPFAGVIMLATIAAAAFNLLPLEMATLAGAVAVVLTRTITARQAYRSIDPRIYVFIAGAIPLGEAMQKSGTAKLMAGGLQVAIGGWGETWILLSIFAVVSVITQFMSDAATTALFAPVAVALAQALGHAPEAYVVTVAMASVAAFLTPIGHHGNLLIYGPGGYQFADFVRVGTPLTILVGIVVVLLTQVIWPL